MLSLAGSSYEDDARYYTGRSHYALGQLDTAKSDFAALVSAFPSSQYIDNSLYYEARIEADRGNCAAARTLLTTLTSQFPQSTNLSPANSYLSAHGCG